MSDSDDTDPGNIGSGTEHIDGLAEVHCDATVASRNAEKLLAGDPVEPPASEVEANPTDAVAVDGVAAARHELAEVITLVVNPFADLAKRSRGDPGAPYDPVMLRRLAKLRKEEPAVYERLLRDLRAADVRIGRLEEVIKKESGNAASGEALQGSSLDLPEIKPAKEPVDGSELIAALIEAIRRYVVMESLSALTVALWILFCHAHEISEFSPRLMLKSATKRCAKSRLLDIISFLVPRAMQAASLTPAVFLRVVEKEKPTLLIDEADNLRVDEGELLSLLNNGHRRRGAYAYRVEGDGHEIRRFSVYAPVAMAGLGRRAHTLEDRSLEITLRRRLRSEPIKRLRMDQPGELDELAGQCARWVADNLERLRGADPDMPEAMNDRARDNWRLIIAIADAIGGPWSAMAREAAKAISGAGADAAAVEDEVQLLLLADVYDLLVKADEDADKFDRARVEGLASAAICTALKTMEERPWPTFGRAGKGITERHIARLLRPFGLRPREISKGAGEDRERFQGYGREEILSAYTPYMPLGTSPESASISASSARQGNQGLKSQAHLRDGNAADDEDLAQPVENTAMPGMRAYEGPKREFADEDGSAEAPEASPKPLERNNIAEKPNNGGDVGPHPADGEPVGSESPDGSAEANGTVYEVDL